MKKRFSSVRVEKKAYGIERDRHSRQKWVRNDEKSRALKTRGIGLK